MYARLLTLSTLHKNPRSIGTGLRIMLGHELRRIPLPRTPVNKLPIMRRNPAGGIMLMVCRPGRETRVGKEVEVPVSSEEKNKALIRRFLETVHTEGDL